MQTTGTTVHMVARAELSISRLSEQLLSLLQERHQPPEPLIPPKFPTLPFQKVETDLFY